MKRLYILASVTLVFSTYCLAAELTAEIPKGDSEFIAKATSAAPADIGKDATIIRLADGFNPTTVREGKNGWTCAIDLDGAPWCADAVGVEWFKSVYTQAEPADKTGFVYVGRGPRRQQPRSLCNRQIALGSYGSARHDRRKGSPRDGRQLPEQGGPRSWSSLRHVSGEQEVSAPDASRRHGKRT